MGREELKRLTKEGISRRIREGVKAVIERVLEEEMTERLATGYRERTPSHRGERSGYYARVHPGPHRAGGQDRPAPGT